MDEFETRPKSILSSLYRQSKVGDFDAILVIEQQVLLLRTSLALPNQWQSRLVRCCWRSGLQPFLFFFILLFIRIQN